jgi:predicted RecA/RadA family phage recombinase
MAQNHIHPGGTIEVTLGSGETALKVGDGRLVGSMFGVILSLTRAGQTVFSNQASAQGDIAVISLQGVYAVKKTNPLVINLGDKLYWDNTAKELNKTNTNTFVGYAYAAAANTDGTVQIKLQTA